MPGGFSGNRPMGVGAYAARQARREKDRQRAEQGNEGRRKREVYDVDMVAHLWANQSQQSARNGGSNNFYFEGPTIYSYGPHFPIATIVERKGKRCVLMTTKTYSITTSGHVASVRGALRGEELVFHVVEIYSTHKDGVKQQCDEYAARIMGAAKTAQTARARKDERINALESLVSEANQYAKFFGSNRKFKVPSDFDIAAENKKAKRNAAARKQHQEAAERQNVIDRQKHAIVLDQWVKGVNVPRWSYQLADDHENTRLRINAEKDTIETSRGAECPVKHGLRILHLIRAGKEYHRNGHTEHLGAFVVDSIDAEGNLYAGCHTVKRAEIERIATLLGEGIAPYDSCNTGHEDD